MSWRQKHKWSVGEGGGQQQQEKKKEECVRVWGMGVMCSTQQFWKYPQQEKKTHTNSK